MVNVKLVSFLLRAGLAIVFLYAGIASLVDPVSWTGYIPPWFREIIPAETFLFLHSVGEIILALWLLSGKRAYEAAIVSALAITAIIIFNLNLLDIVFRDVAILIMATALAALSKSKQKLT